MKPRPQASKNTKKIQSANPEILIATTQQLAMLFDVSARTIRNWSDKRGLPKQSHGQYAVRDALLWWAENIYGIDTPEIEDVKRDYWRAKAEGERIKVDTLRGKLIPEDHVIPEWAGRMAEISAGLQNLAARINPLLEGKDRSERQKIIDDSIWELLDNYCRAGQFCSKEH